MACCLSSHARDLHARESRARDEKKKRPQMSRLSPFVLNDLVLSFLSLECPFRPVLWPFCPSNKRLKFDETVYFC